MGEILTPIAFQIELLRLTEGTLAANKRRGHPADIAKGRKAAERAEKALAAHNAALRAEVERLAEKVRRIESACGLPDPAEACRVILAIAAEEGK